jgi:hypothetical protein
VFFSYTMGQISFLMIVLSYYSPHIPPVRLEARSTPHWSRDAIHSLDEFSRKKFCCSFTYFRLVLNDSIR